MSKISVLICDDSALMRRSLKKIINSDPSLHVIGTARDGEDAVVKARELMPDVITMDINMPGIDGITALQVIVNENIAPVLMVSSLTQEGAIATFESLALGAFDYVGKPGGTVSRDIRIIEQEIIKKIKAAARTDVLKKIKSHGSELRKNKRKSRREVKVRVGTGYRSQKPVSFKAVALGISTGGPKTIYEVLPFLPEKLNAAVFVVQHMPPAFIPSYVKRLDEACQMPVVQTEGGMEIKPGTIYIGEGGYHLKIFRKLSGKIIVRSSRSPEHLFVPSVGVMMESVLDVFGDQTVGVLMTGMGDDGADAMVKITESGGWTIAENEESAIVFGMPREAIERGGAHISAPSWEIADEIVRSIEK